MILNMKVVPNDTFKCGGERVKVSDLQNTNTNKWALILNPAYFPPKDYIFVKTIAPKLMRTTLSKEAIFLSSIQGLEVMGKLVSLKLTISV